jgi:hypothetical protein
MQPTIEELFEGCKRPPKGCIVIEPFVGNGDIMKWIGSNNIIIPYDSDPKVQKVMRRDVFTDKPKYSGTYIITKPPQLKKLDSDNKTVFELYGTDNLYKCFIKCILSEQPAGGIIILPIAFMSGLRESEIKRRLDFFKAFKPLRLNIFNMDTVVINFEKRPYNNPFESEDWNFHLYPDNMELSIAVNKYPREIQSMPYNRPEKYIGCKYGSAPIKGWLRTRIIMISTDLNCQKMGLYISNEEDNDCKENRIHIKGFISKKRQQKICTDVNNWIQNEKLSKTSMLVPFTYISSDLTLEVIKRTIWYYYTVDSQDSQKVT